ncbi:hypothetical protein [Bifidobacterium sp.]|uniref:hypothetical protein n=1 Tax=Bifidobacterium sp. TaxID=41200 RepID=UPI0039EB1F74
MSPGINGKATAKTRFEAAERFHMRLYALTSISSVGWLVQSMHSSLGEPAFFSVAHVVLWLCILTTIVYTGYNAFVLNRELKVAKGGGGSDAVRDADAMSPVSPPHGQGKDHAEGQAAGL